MKKYLSILLASTLTIGAVSCGSEEPATTTDTTGTETTTETTTEETTSSEPVTITYLDWSMGPEGEDNLERAMVASFQEANPNITVELLTVPEGDNYNNYIATLAASNQMPDVFAWASVPDSVLREWAYDASEVANADADYANTQQVIREGGQIDGKTFGIPKAMNYLGLFINKSVYDENNVPYLEFGFTTEEMMAAIEKNTTATTKGVDNFAIHQWYPLTQSADLGFATFNGEAYNFAAPEYAAGVEIAQTVTNNNWDMKNTTPLEFFGQEGWAFGGIGGIATNYDGTWIFDGIKNNPNDKYDYVGLPNGYTVVANDYLFLGKSTQHPQEAYELAKWMGFGKDGLTARFDLADASENYKVNSVPVLNDDEISARYLELFADYPGFTTAFNTYREKQDLLVVEGYKEVPGFARSVYDADTGVQSTDADGNAISLTQAQLTDKILKGEEKLADHAQKMTEIANAEYATAKAELAEKIK